MEPAEIRIGERIIGAEEPCYIIAEAGVNHNGNLSTALELVDVAAEAGADAVKFQTFNPDEVVTKTANKARYQKASENDTETFYEMLCRLQLTYDDFRKLSNRAREQGITFISKGYKQELDFLFELNVPLFKIDSASIIYYSYLRKAAEFGIPIVLSTGTATLGEVEKALKLIYETGNRQVILLHCTTAYPAPNEQINLRAMLTLKNAFGLNVGLSDHSMGIEVSLAAVALGATVIEKHFTLDRNQPGPDHRASLEPDELHALVQGVSKVQAALGSPYKAPTRLERENMLVVRRSLVAECDIKAGESFKASMVSFKRPSGGLGEEFQELILGRVATRDISEGEPITWDMVGGLFK
jgi:N-acetylneuraminate synthase